jgi:hypothetical protein
MRFKIEHDLTVKPLDEMTIEELEQNAGKEIYCEIVKPTRSLRCLNLFWLWMTEIGWYHGYKKEEMRIELFIYLTDLNPDLKLYEIKTNQKGKERVYYQSVDKHTTQERMNEIMNAVWDYAKSKSIRIADPDDLIILNQ